MFKLFSIGMLVLGFIFMKPSIAIGCHKGEQLHHQAPSKTLTEKTTPTHQVSEKNCCQNQPSSADSKASHCDDSCKSSGCVCPTMHCTFAGVKVWYQLEKTIFHPLLKTHYFPYRQTYPSDPCALIWTPPKIA